MILRRTDLSRKNGWADEYGKIYLYYPINEVCELLHCGRQKAVDTLRELQYADLVSIKKQGNIMDKDTKGRPRNGGC